VWVVVAGDDLNKNLRSGNLSQGSGVAVTKSLLLTNCHVISDHKEIGILQSGSAWRAVLESADSRSDRCILRIATNSLVPVPGVKHYADLEVGQKVFTVGSPSTLENTLSDGLISGLRRTKRGNYIQTTAQISPGSSGGGLFDASGNLIGVTTLTLNEGGSLNFAIAASEYWE